MNVSELREAIEAIKAGDKETGRRLLTQYVQTNPHNEVAWLWLAAAVPEPEQKQQCLQRVLDINPDNVTAQQGLAQLRAAAITEDPPTLEEIVAAGSSEKPVRPLKPLSSARLSRPSEPQSSPIQAAPSASALTDSSPANTDQTSEIVGLYLKVILLFGGLPVLLFLSVWLIAMFIVIRPGLNDIGPIFNVMMRYAPIPLGMGALGILLGIVMVADQVRSVRQMPSGHLKGAFNRHQIRGIELKLAYEDAFDLCFELAVTKGHIERQDRSQGKIVARTSVTLGFWSSSAGEIISFGLNRLDANKTSVTISSQPIHRLALFDKGRNLGNVEEITIYLKLKEQQ